MCTCINLNLCFVIEKHEFFNKNAFKKLALLHLHNCSYQPKIAQHKSLNGQNNVHYFVFKLIIEFRNYCK